MKRYFKVNFNELGDERGHLVVAECNKEIPFNISRVFYMYGTQKDVVRGMHANRNSSFVLINLKGTCKIYCNDGVNEEDIVLDKPHEGIFLQPMVWKNMYEFSEDSILLVMSDYLYDSSEYIRDFNEFLSETSCKE